MALACFAANPEEGGRRSAGALAGEAERTWAARAHRIQALLARVRGDREG